MKCLERNSNIKVSIGLVASLIYENYIMTKKIMFFLFCRVQNFAGSKQKSILRRFQVAGSFALNIPTFLNCPLLKGST